MLTDDELRALERAHAVTWSMRKLRNRARYIRRMRRVDPLFGSKQLRNALRDLFSFGRATLPKPSPNSLMANWVGDVALGWAREASPHPGPQADFWAKPITIG